MAVGYGVEVVEVGLRDGVTDAGAWAEAIDGETSAVVLQQPNHLGAVEDVAALAEAAKNSPAVVVGAYDPITLGVLAPPGECGVDVAVGEGQPLGNRLDFGGPSFGFFAATEAYLRRMPGRIAGETRRRRRPPRLRAHAADARAAHPAREGDLEHLHGAGAQRAGRRRLPRLARPPRARRARRAAAAAHALRARDARRPRRRPARCTAGRSCASSRVDARRAASRAVVERCRALGVNPGVPLGARPAEARRRAARGHHRAALARGHRPPRRRARRRRRRRAPRARGGGADERRPGARPARARARRCSARPCARSTSAASPAGARSSAPALDVPEADPETLLPAHLRRREPARLPEVSEPELVRHYVRLSKRNFDLDSGFYPLGSCTMKHNPRLHERVAALPGHARLHPLQDPEHAQGALELMWRLERALGRGRRTAARLAAARGRRARRARRRAAHARLPRRPRRRRGARS